MCFGSSLFCGSEIRETVEKESINELKWATRNRISMYSDRGTDPIDGRRRHHVTAVIEQANESLLQDTQVNKEIHRKVILYLLPNGGWVSCVGFYVW
jgi:hypothetical protein